MLTLNEVTKIFNPGTQDEKRALDDFSINVAEGDFITIIGSNGAGKTTTLRMLTGFLQPTTGSIHVKDYSIDERPLEIKKILGYLPESAPLYHDMLVFDYLHYVAAIRGIEKDRRLKRADGKC